MKDAGHATPASANRETPMFRKTTLALAAVATLATAAAAIPTEASAHGWRHHRHHHPQARVVVRFGAPYYAARHYAYAPACFTKKRWVHKRWGWQVQRVRVCR
jgi:hypothetical protein